MLADDPSTAAAIRPARWPADRAVVRALLESYFATLRSNPEMPQHIRNLDRSAELDRLDHTYGDTDRRVMLLACAEAKALGCVAVSLLPWRQTAAEVKRLFVEPGARGRGLGHSLVQAAAAWAKAHGAHELLLDTVPQAMHAAVRLYGAAGFVPTERYNKNDGPEFAFYRLALE